MSFREQLEAAIDKLETDIKVMKVKIIRLSKERDGFGRLVLDREEEIEQTEREMELLIREKKLYENEANGN